MASEAGVLDLDPSTVVQARCGCSRAGCSWSTPHRAASSTTRRSRPSWPPSTRIRNGSTPGCSTSTTLPQGDYVRMPHHRVVLRQQAFGYTYEELNLLVAPMARTGAEPLGSMGTDTPVAVLSQRPRMLFDYFQQLFAQVTNPPLDAIREEVVTSLQGTVGPEGDLLNPTPDSCRQIVLPQPILRNARAGQADQPRSRARDPTASKPRPAHRRHPLPVPGEPGRPGPEGGARQRPRQGVCGHP